MDDEKVLQLVQQYLQEKGYVESLETLKQVSPTFISWEPCAFQAFCLDDGGEDLGFGAQPRSHDEAGAAIWEVTKRMLVDIGRRAVPASMTTPSRWVDSCAPFSVSLPSSPMPFPCPPQRLLPDLSSPVSSPSPSSRRTRRAETHAR